MAEAFARIQGSDRVEAYSAGSRPSGVVNPKAIESMRELGYDLGAHGSKSLDDIPQVEYDFVATMGCATRAPSCERNTGPTGRFPIPRTLRPRSSTKSAI